MNRFHTRYHPTPKNHNPESMRIYMYIIYALFSLAIFSYGGTAIIGVMLAYIKRMDMRDTAYYDHLCFLIRTFWATFIISLIGWLLTIIFIGWIILSIIFFWYLFRIILGIVRLVDNAPINPKGWLM